MSAPETSLGPVEETTLVAVGHDLQAALGRYLRSTVGEWRLMLAELEQQYEKARWKPADEREHLQGMLSFTRSTINHLERLLVQSPPASERVSAADVTWYDLSATWTRDEADGQALWARIKHIAAQEQRTGRTGASAIASQEDRPRTRAEYLVVWDELADGLRPTNGTERLLIDGLTQAILMQRHWLQVMVRTEALDAIRHSRHPRETTEPPRLSEAAAVDRAMAMQERFSRMFIRLLTAYNDQRRLFSTLVVSGGQVNIAADGGQQLVATRSIRSATPRRIRAKRRPPRHAPPA